MKKTIITFGIIVLAVAIAGMYKFNYLSSQPGRDVDGNKTEENLTTGTDKFFGIDQGTISPSDTVGFKSYKNKQLNVSFLTPDSWQGQVGIGGSYTIMPKNIDKNTIVDIAARTTTFDWLTQGNSPKNPSIEDYKKMQEAFITEENIGKDLKVVMEKVKFAEQLAYKIYYTYTLADGTQNFSEKYFTVLKDGIYSIEFGGLLTEKETYQDTFDTVKNSYKILDMEKEQLNKDL